MITKPQIKSVKYEIGGVESWDYLPVLHEIGTQMENLPSHVYDRRNKRVLFESDGLLDTSGFEERGLSVRVRGIDNLDN